MIQKVCKMYQITIKNKTIENLLEGVGLLFLLVSTIWFFIVVGSVNPHSLPMLEIGKPLPQKMPDNITYQIQIQNTVIVLHEASVPNHATFDVGQIIDGVIIGGILMILKRILKKFFPDKPKDNRNKI
ncbi:MAG: hypothetical protein KGL95_05565 [Patescibacteria group bacterium]|nr:hypothetical protein [Patescibacteria group bacterium]